MPAAISSVAALAGAAGLRLDFPAGLPAFEHETAFLLLAPQETAPLVFLQSERTPGLCFVGVAVEQIVPDYELSLSSEDLVVCGFEDGRVPHPEEIAVIALLSCTGEETTANLLAPIVIHLARRRAAQAVRADRLYSHRYPVRLADPEAERCS